MGAAAVKAPFTYIIMKATVDTVEKVVLIARLVKSLHTHTLYSLLLYSSAHTHTHTSINKNTEKQKIISQCSNLQHSQVKSLTWSSPRASLILDSMME